MTRTLRSVIGLALVIQAPADVRFFFTSSADAAGLDKGYEHRFDDTAGDGKDFSAYTLKPDAPIVGVPTINPAKGEFLWLWLRFESEPDDRRIQIMHMVANDQSFTGGVAEVDRGIYLGDDANDSGEKRWETASKTTDAMTLAGGNSRGIKNVQSDDFLYEGGGRYALLGAIAPGAADPDESYALHLGLGKKGISYRGQTAPNVKFGGNEEQFSGRTRTSPDYLYSSDADAVVLPEPTSVLLLAIAGFAFSRRRHHSF